MERLEVKKIMSKRLYFIVPFLILVLVFSFIGCTNNNKDEEAKDYIRSFKLTFEEFKDTYNLAGSTSRIALSPIISDMQRLKRDLYGLELPEKCDEYNGMQNYCVESMEKAIDAYIKFQQQEDDLVVFSLLESVDTRFEYTDNWIEEIEESFKE